MIADVTSHRAVFKRNQLSSMSTIPDLILICQAEDMSKFPLRLDQRLLRLNSGMRKHSGSALWLKLHVT